MYFFMALDARAQSSFIVEPFKRYAIDLAERTTQNDQPVLGADFDAHL